MARTRRTPTSSWSRYLRRDRRCLARADGIAGKVTIDATSALGGRNDAFPSLAHEIKADLGGPTAKAFNINFAALYEQAAAQRARPSNLFAAEADAEPTVRQLTMDVGHEPVLLGDLDQAITMLVNERGRFARSVSSSVAKAPTRPSRSRSCDAARSSPCAAA